MIKNEMPAYELISGALIAIGAIFLILPGFATDTLGFLLFSPQQENLFLKYFLKKKKMISNKKIILKENTRTWMSEKKFKIILEYIKDLSVETPSASTLLYVRENLINYNLDIDISSLC